MKKLLLIIALLISALGLNAQSVTIGDLEFTVTSKTPAECEVSGYSGEPTDVTIPSTVTISGKEYTVTSIGDDAFVGCSSLTSIEIPSGVTSIGDGAFFWCSSLTSIEIPSGVTSIGDDAFFCCSSLTSIEIPSGVTSIVYYAFSGCSSLTSVTFGENSKLTSIGEWAFYDCSSLTSIDFGENSKLTSIGDDAFVGCSSLTSIEIPSGVTSIGESAFSGCSSLTSIIVESGNTVYDSRDNCNAIIETATNTLIVGCQNTVIPSSVTSIGEWAFSDCSSLTSVTFGENSKLTSIGEWAFSWCSSLTSIEIPSGVTSIGEWAFESCESLTSVTFGENSKLTSIGKSAFSDCSSLTSIDFGENSQLTSIGESAFSGCSSLTSIEIPSGVTSIGYYAFSGCSSLTSIEIPNGVTSIGYYAFSGCSSLTSIYCYAESVPETDGDAFYNCPSDMVIYVPEQSVDAYKAASPWNEYTILAMPNYEIAVVIAPSESGVVTGAGTYNDGEEVTLTATANEGYKFINWTENGEVVSEEAEYSFEITKDRNLVANFEEIEDPENPGENDETCTITAVANPKEGGSISGAGTYKKDMKVTLTATAKSGFEFVNWTENGIIVSIESEYSFTVTKDISLVANFVALEYEVIVVVNPKVAGEVEGAGTYKKNTSVTLTATANEGYKFVSWAENGEVISETSEYSFVVTRDVELIANFVSTEGVEELASSFDIYPNPVSDKLYIETEVEIEEVSIFDIYGRRQELSAISCQPSAIDVSGLNSGVYFVKIVTSEGEAVKRFIKK